MDHMTYRPRPYYQWTSSAPSVVLPAGTYMFRHTGGGGAGGGCPASAASTVTIVLTAYAKPSASSLSFLNCNVLTHIIMGFANTPNLAITVTGPGITGQVFVFSMVGTTVQLGVGTGSIGTLNGTANYTFTIQNSGGGGGSSQPSDQTIVSDGVTAFDITVGAGGTGVSGAGGNAGGLTTVTQGTGIPPDLALNSPYGGGGSVGGASFIGQGGSSIALGPLGVAPGAFFYAGSGGSLVSGPSQVEAGFASYQNPAGGQVGGGCGGPATASLGGGAGEQGWIVGGGNPGASGASGTVTGQNGLAAVSPNYGCGGGGAGGNATAAALANIGGAGYQGRVEAWRVA